MSSRKKPLDRTAVISVIISSVTSIIVTYIATSNNYSGEIIALESQIKERDAQILILQNKLDESDKEKLTLQEQIRKITHPLEELMLQNGKAEFEWQWAGENWYGRVILENQGNVSAITQAQVGLIEKNTMDSIFMNGQVLNLTPGTGDVKINGNTIHIEFTTNKKDRRDNMEHTVVITGDLYQALCFAGTVKYNDLTNGNTYPGDMILTNYISQLGDLINYWFSPNKNQPWFDKYIID